MKKSVAYFLFVILSISISAQDWIIQNPFSKVVTVLDIVMQDDGRGVAVGDQGLILITNNFGERWDFAEAPHSSAYRFVHSITGTNGQVVLAGGQRLARSTDGGISWEAVDNSIDNVQSFHSVDQNIVFLTTIQRGIYKSIDGGGTWTKLENAPGENHEDIYFFNEMNGLSFGRFDSGKYKFISTSDGGLSWTELEGEYPFLQRMDFSSDLLGFAVGPEMVLKTTDGGATWSFLTNSPNSTNDITVINENVIWVLRGLGYNFSLDGGETWSDNGSPNGGGDTKGIFALDDQNIWITQANTTIKRTTDGGETWVDQVGGSKDFIESIDMINRNVGFAASGVENILITNNGGASWELFPTIKDHVPTKMKAINAQHILMVGRNGLIRSTDGAQNWSEVPNLTTWLNTVEYFSDNRLIMGSIQGDIWRSDITGAQATIVQNLGSDVKGADFGDNGLGFAVTRNGLIYRTTDSGDSWSQVYDNEGELSTVYVLTNQIILAAQRFNQNLLRSSDGGNTWNIVDTGLATFWGEFSFYDDQNGYLVGGSATQGRILRTEDAGLTWISDFLGTTSFAAIETPSAGERLAWAVGNGGLIMRYSDCNATPIFSSLDVLDEVCTNNVISLSVNFSGVDIFEWTIPSAFEIIGTDASAQIDLMMGESSGTVSIKGKNSCGDETEVLMVELNPKPNPDPVINQTGVTLFCETSASLYQWYKDGEQVTGETASEYAPTQSGSFHVQVEYENGCPSQASNAINFVISSVKDIEKLGVSVYPNPAHDVFRLYGLSAGDRVDVFQINGGYVSRLNPLNAEFDITDLKPGLYILRVTRNADQGVLKLLIQ